MISISLNKKLTGRNKRLKMDKKKKGRELQSRDKRAASQYTYFHIFIILNLVEKKSDKRKKKIQTKWYPLNTFQS